MLRVFKEMHEKIRTNRRDGFCWHREVVILVPLCLRWNVVNLVDVNEPALV